MQYFIDGSSVRMHGGYRGVGWAIKEAADKGTEYSGFFFSKQDYLSCELVAFIMLVSKVPREKWHELSVYTDSDEVLQPLEFLVSNQSHTKGRQSFNRRVASALREVMNAYPAITLTVEDVLTFLATVRLNKLKAHSGLIDNGRVDYLARTDLYTYLLRSPFRARVHDLPHAMVEGTLPYDEWLAYRLAEPHSKVGMHGA